jgi:ribosome-associated toxin RatA of RatAB toxin-antitoxin module
LAVALSVLGQLPTNPNPWQLLRDDRDLKLWGRPVPSSTILQLRAEMEVDATPRKVWNLLRDVERVVEYNPYISESRIRSEQGDTRYIYQRFVPPVIADRDVTFKAVAYEDEANGVFQQLITLANNQGPPPVDGVVRVKVLEAQWSIEPADSGKTRVCYWIHTDPGGLIPDWLVNFAQERSVPKLFAAFKNRLRDPRWRP